VLNYNDTSGGQNFGGGEHGKFVTLTSVNAAVVPEASSFLFAAIACTALAAAHFARTQLKRRIAAPCGRIALRRG
jgi:hypothetical protein